MTYVNPLHLPVLSSHLSGYTTLGGGVQSPTSRSQFMSPFRRSLPQARYVPSSKWRTATGRASRLNNPITFDYIGYDRQGVRMRELSTRGSRGLETMIKGASDHVLVHTGLRKVTFRILWPGYENIEWARVIELNDAQGPITRAQLGTAVAMNFGRFMEKARSEPPTLLDWKLGYSGIRYEHVILVALHNVFDDIWQADVAIDLR